MNKKTVAVVFGGCSSEHDISCISVQTVVKAMNPEKYDVILIGITKDGRWLLAESVQAIADGSWRDSKVSAIILPDRGIHGVMLTDETGRSTCVRVDTAFPVLHGLYGEDGTIQGLFELADIPYVGCGVIASAASMDKFYTKIVAALTGVRQAEYTPIFGEKVKNDIEYALDKVEAQRSYPVFVKPSRAGSSVGVSKASNREELREALILAAKHDRKILVEEMIKGREIECAVLGTTRHAQASGLGEILAADVFYSYDAKYSNADSKTVVGPELPEGVTEKVRDYAVKIFRVLDGFGLARVDFFVCDDGEIVFNEINTLPGFTSISMYPMLWNHEGLSNEEIIDRLIAMADER
ncbi:MAG: D-alanine--D-alanine ligase [Lachnospiraceae bacterium]|nr:D-alanine--D-alanine ligase [Lachnospiraceae bacterium]